MPTVEERLAALEAKMAAWIDQQPTTYYTHQYSGEEIDAAVGRALTGGALDTSVTNVSNQLGTFVRPNLLDNWYFGRPVDQKKGMLQLAGTMLYSDAACTQAMFPSTKTTSIIKVSDIAAHPSDNSTVYVKLADCVRGYTGAFAYTIDRWQIGDGSISLTVAADGIVLKGGNNANTDYTYTRVERLPVGKYTFSVLFADNTANVVLTTKLTDISAIQAVESREASGVLALTWDQPEEFKSDNAYFRIHAPGSVKILAAKLELGPTQTLAHKEGERWVLNEIPKYSRELLDCRTYFVKFGYADKYCILGSGVARDDTFVSITVPIPAELRTYPAVILTGAIIIRHSDVMNQTCTTVAWDANGVSSILLKIKASGLTPGDAYEAFLAPGNYLEVSCDL